MEHKRQMLERCVTGDVSFNAHRDVRSSVLEPKDEALARLGALVALGAPEALSRRAIVSAFEAGACEEDVVAALVTVATIIGHARVVSAAPAIALGIGFGVDEALQR